MARANRDRVNLNVDLPREFVSQLDELAARNCRTRTDEIIRGLLRHLSYPEPIGAPGPVDEAKIPPKGKPGRKPKQATVTAPELFDAQAASEQPKVARPRGRPRKTPGTEP